MTTLNPLLAKTGWIVADGATGTNYLKQGLETGYPPELYIVEKPDEVAALHSAFIDAGSQLILTNSFGGTACPKSRRYGSGSRWPTRSCRWLDRSDG